MPVWNEVEETWEKKSKIYKESKYKGTRARRDKETDSKDPRTTRTQDEEREKMVP